MRLLLLSDVHGNLEALEAVLADADAIAPEARLICAGDVLGYGPEPNECLERLRDRGAGFVIGNHEEMVLGRRGFERCTHAGIRAALFTRARLSAEARAFVERWPAFLEVNAGVVVCHGDLESADRYVSDAPRARAALSQLARLGPAAELLVCGHTHHAALFSEPDGFEVVGTSLERALPAGRVLLNPGAVGQARDARPLARYAVLDLDRRRLHYRAIGYDHERTLAKLRRAGLVPRVVMPPPLGLGRHIEHWRTQWARRWAARQAVWAERAARA